MSDGGPWASNGDRGHEIIRLRTRVHLLDDRGVEAVTTIMPMMRLYCMRCGCCGICRVPGQVIKMEIAMDGVRLGTTLRILSGLSLTVFMYMEEASDDTNVYNLKEASDIKGLCYHAVSLNCN